MWRLAALMTLIAALTGTPLRQAEAADDLCRSLLGMFQPASLDIPDGGVGDDSGIGTLSVPPSSGLTNPLTSVAPLLTSPVSAQSPATRGDVESLRELVWSTSNPPNERNAWLQAFLF
jgi:hypothetical protein